MPQVSYELKKMNYFIIGDIHGCYYTLNQLLTHWKKEEETLILVGDLIDRGKYSAEVVLKAMELTSTYDNCIVLKGNHEAELIQYIIEGSNENWTRQGGDVTLAHFAQKGIQNEVILPWLVQRPLCYETPHFIVTHAGIAETEDPFLEEGDDSVLWNRKPLKAIGKLQIHGHTPLKSNQAQYTPDSDSWNIDTGAYYGYGLTGLRIAADATVIESLTIPTDQRDIR
jgi:serine/threonine protein phosphatase 1